MVERRCRDVFCKVRLKKYTAVQDRMRRFDPRQLESIRESFFARGETVADWSRRHGFEPAMVYQVLAGRRACRSGSAHHIALALGLKKPPSDAETGEFALTNRETVM